MSEQNMGTEEKKVFLREFLVTGLVCLVPIVVGFSLWDFLPETIPVHFDIKGQPNRILPKLQAILELPLLMVIANSIIQYGIYREKEGLKNVKIRSLLVWLIPVTTQFVAGLEFASALNTKMNVLGFTNLFVGLLFVAIGNYLPKTSPNKLIGFRLPGVMKDSELWWKTHRIGGMLMVAAGLLTMMAAFTPAGFPVMVFSILISIIVPSVYAQIKSGRSS